MNVRVMTTNELLNQWTKTDRGKDQPIIDELHRRCKAGGFCKFVDPESLYVFSFFTDRHGELRMFGEPKVAVFDDLDKFIETPPQATDRLAFEPSDELDAATLAT